MYESGMDLPANYGLCDLLLQPDPPSCSMVNEQTMQALVSGQYGGEFINPDDFLNDIHQSQAESPGGSSPSNRDTPSPAGSQQSLESVPSSGGFESCHVVPMAHFESPPISPLGPVSPSQVCQQQSKPCETKLFNTGTMASGRRIKILPKTSANSNITKTITKKTIVLSAKDYKALIANTLKQPSNNTILLKATSATNAPIVPAKIVKPAVQNKPIEIPAVLPPLAFVQNKSAPLVTSTDAVTSAPLAIPMMRTQGTAASDPTIDEKTLKKHQRMIKNRQSAYESRMKKKEYVSSLEDRIQELSNENAQLRQVDSILNSLWKRHVAD